MAFSIQQWGAINGLIHMNYSQRMYEAPAGGYYYSKPISFYFKYIFLPYDFSKLWAKSNHVYFFSTIIYWFYTIIEYGARNRSEERRVGKEGICRWSQVLERK